MKITVVAFLILGSTLAHADSEMRCFRNFGAKIHKLESYTVTFDNEKPTHAQTARSADADESVQVKLIPAPKHKKG